MTDTPQAPDVIMVNENHWREMEGDGEFVSFVPLANYSKLVAGYQSLTAERDRLRKALHYMVNHAGQLERNEGVFWEATEIARAALSTTEGEG